MTDALNPEPLLRALHEAGVQHIIIGGFAVNAHGVIRPSRDLDIVPNPDPANLKRLAALLADLGARHVGLGDSMRTSSALIRRTQSTSVLERTSGSRRASEISTSCMGPGDRSGSRIWCPRVRGDRGRA
jgi:hypothetical protein